MTSLLDRVKNILHKDRAISMPNIYQLVYAALDQQMQADETYRTLIDVYLEQDATLYAVIGVNGLLYKYPVTVAAGTVTLGLPSQVQVDYQPVAQSIKVTRQANGQYRWFAFPAATAVLNRSGELDSRELFDNFVKRIEEGADYPFLSFYHIGEQIHLGQADYVAVDGYTLLMSGVWDETPLAEATRTAIESNPEYYGISIGYMYAPETRQKIEIGEGIQIPLYTDGILIECSILAEKDAACLMTGAYTEGVNRMNKKAEAELDKILGDDPALKEIGAALKEKVDSVNAATDGLIRRESTEVAPTEPSAPVVDVVEAVKEVEAGPSTGGAPTEPVAQAVEPPAPAELELTDETVQVIANLVADKTRAASDDMAAKMKTMADEMAAMAEEMAGLKQDIATLKAPLEQTVKQTIADMPRNTKTVVAYRPTQRTQAEQPVTVTSEDIAADTLAKIKAKGA